MNLDNNNLDSRDLYPIEPYGSHRIERVRISSEYKDTFEDLNNTAKHSTQGYFGRKITSAVSKIKGLLKRLDNSPSHSDDNHPHGAGDSC